MTVERSQAVVEEEMLRGKTFDTLKSWAFEHIARGSIAIDLSSLKQRLLGVVEGKPSQ